MIKKVHMDAKKLLELTNFCLKQLDKAMEAEDPEEAMQSALLAKTIAETLQALGELNELPGEYRKLKSLAQPQTKIEEESGEEQEIFIGAGIPEKYSK